MAFLTGIFFIVFMSLVAVAVWRVAVTLDRSSGAGISHRSSLSRGHRVALVLGYGALAVLLVILLFRPDEEMESGEDAGGYFNAALSYAGRGTLWFSDPALAEVAPAARQLFRYGNAGFLQTKDAVLWSPDPEAVQVGPHFLPAYSVLLGVPVRLGFPYAAFWTSPVFAILVGGLLALLGTWLTGRRLAGGVAFFLFLLNPAVIWNARCLRAEWPASFLALAGVVLWLAQVVLHKRMSPVPAFLGGLALAVAGSFHVTAFFVLVPTVLGSFWLTRRTAPWAAWWCGLFLGCALFLAQVIWITDPYWLKHLWRHAGRRGVFLWGGVITVLSLSGLRWAWSHFNGSRLFTHFHLGRLAGGFFSLTSVLIILFSMRYRNDLGLIPGLPSWTTSYASLTDFEGVLRIFSWFGFSMAVAGLIPLCVRSGMGGSLGRWLFFLLAPSSLTIGWVFNYMFETRRMVTFLVPLLVLSTTVLVMTISAWSLGVMKRNGAAGWVSFPRLETGLPCFLVVLLLFSAVRGRTWLYTTWNNRGTYRFYRELAREVREAGDFLLAEYTQTAAPIERLSGLPLLPIAWGYRSDSEYRRAEKVWEQLVRERGDRRYLLISPFSGAAIPGTQVELLASRTLSTVRLERVRREVPTEVRTRLLTLHVSRVSSPGREGTTLPYSRLMDRGLLGIDGSANHLPGRTITLSGVRLDAPVEVLLPSERTAGHLYCILAFPGVEGTVPVAVASLPGMREEVIHFSTGTSFQGLELSFKAMAPSKVTLNIQVQETGFVTDIFWVNDDPTAVERLAVTTPSVEFQMSGIDSMWLEATASLALPVGTGPRFLWMLATSGRNDDVDVHFTLQPRGSGAAGTLLTLPKGWNWHLVHLPDQVGAGFAWHDLVVTPPWNPELKNFPNNLGLRVHQLTVTDAPKN